MLYTHVLDSLYLPCAAFMCGLSVAVKDCCAISDFFLAIVPYVCKYNTFAASDTTGMIAFRYKLYRTKNTKHLDRLLREAAFVWNHALALQKRFFKMFHKYISVGRMKKHFASRISRCLLHSQSTQEILERLDTAYQRFFNRLAKRPPKFRKASDFSSVVFKQGGFSLNGNVLTVNRLKKRFRFSLSRPYPGIVKRIALKRTPLGEFFLTVTTDAEPMPYGKTHNGASVGIDFGLKSYMVLSDGTRVGNPQFLKADIAAVRRKSRNLSRSARGSNNRIRRRLELCREFERISNRRSDFQWRLVHNLCRRFDYIFIEDLNISGMSRLWGRKIADLAHSEFVNKLGYVAGKYGVTVHRIDRFFPSSKTCQCGYINHGLSLKDRSWTCPDCGRRNDRDLNAAQNILRRGISELWSGCKPESDSADHVRTQESHVL